ncbi:MAG: shikimate dehydrogenase [Coriobacteriia bacterium]|nr:shikimate dehydrogenase [Coriobacteriia bacterium]
MRSIDGQTKIAGVLGRPLGHSLSPAMHNAVYQQLELNWVYLPVELADEVGLRRFMALAPSLRCVGFNVTMPFKQAVLELCDEVATAASMAGAVNTVHVVEGRLVGYNTDGRGLLEALEEEAGFTPAGKDVVILGAGGAAGAAFVAFLLARAASITVVNRDMDRADELIDRMRGHLGAAKASSVSVYAAEQQIGAADLIVNATPAGMKPEDESPIPVEWLRPGQLVYDMVYGTPEPTALVSGARSVGARALDGLGMLVCQGAIAVDIWNDSKQVRTPRETMRAAAEAALCARGAGGRP